MAAGIKTVEQAKKIIGLGVEKVAISSAALENPQLISVVADQIGSQSVVLVLDVKKKQAGSEYEVWTHNGRKHEKATQSPPPGKPRHSAPARSSSTQSITTAR